MSILKDKYRLFFNCNLNEEGEVQPLKMFGAETATSASISENFIDMSVNPKTNIGVLVTIDGSGNVKYREFLINSNKTVSLGTSAGIATGVTDFGADHITDTTSFSTSSGAFTYFTFGYKYGTLNNIMRVQSVGTKTALTVGTSSIGAITVYKNRLAIGTEDGKIIFSKPNSDDFTIGTTIADALQFQVSSNPIIALESGTNFMIALDSAGELYSFYGNLISTDDAVGLENVGKISSEQLNTNSLIAFNGEIFAGTDNGLLKITNDEVRNFVVLNYSDEKYKKHYNYMVKLDSYNGKYYVPNILSGRYILLNSMAPGTRQNHIGPPPRPWLGMSLVGYDYFSKEYFVWKIDSNDVAPTLLINDFKIRWDNYNFYVSEISTTEYTTTLTPFVVSGIYLSVSEKDYSPLLYLLYREVNTGNIKIDYNGAQQTEINTVSNTDTIYDNVKFKRLLVGIFDEAGQYKITFYGCRIIDLDALQPTAS